MERGLTKQELRDALRSCESEPIHRPGSIQPLGVLLALDDQLIVRHVSRNIASLFGRTTGEVLGRPFADPVGHDQAKSHHELVGLEEWRRTAITEFTLTRGDRHSTFDAQVSHQEGLWIVEIETEERWSGDLFQRLFIPVRDALWELDAENDLGRYTGEVVRQVRLLTGYDRVMMYLFDANWDGEVIAESKRDGVVSYLGNRFPASDIPAQARELYVRNPSRLIADVAAEAVSIEPLLTPATGRPLDMTFSAFRQLSPVHLEYLRNMRVRASLSISLIQNSRLWGLIACHHSTPKHVPLRTRELYEFIGKTVSLKLSNLENNSKIRFYETVHRLLDVLTEEIRGHRDEPAVLDRYESELLGLVQASGAVIVIDGQRRRFGDTPDDEQLNGLEQCLRGLPPATVFHADTLIGICPAAAEFSGRISGMMLAPLNDRLDNYIAWFRPGILAPLPMPADHRVVGFNDQHCHMLVPETSPLQVGDMVSFGVSHPCLTFDKWRVLLVVDDEYDVTSAVETFF